MTEYHKILRRNGKIDIIRKMRKIAIKVRCKNPMCNKTRMTRANDRCKCFYCGETIRIKLNEKGV
jgi:hypothetical protein